MTAIDLPHGESGTGPGHPRNFQPAMSEGAYLTFQRGLSKKERYAATAG